MRLVRSCCARAANGHEVAVPPTSVMNSRRLIASPGAHVTVAAQLNTLEADYRCRSWVIRD